MVPLRFPGAVEAETPSFIGIPAGSDFRQYRDESIALAILGDCGGLFL
jgi:hypothetical protein